jgi:hypothetical protein
MALQLLHRDLAVVDHPLKVGPLAMGARTTAVRRADGSVVVLSPGPLDDADAAAIAAMGPVRAVVAPNLMHHMFAGAALARFAGAALYAPSGLGRKKPALAIAGPPSAAADATLHAVEIGGMPKLDETVFVHAPSRTLIAFDLVFNLRPPAPFFTRLFMRWNGGFDRFGPSRICRSLVKDRAATAAALQRLLANDFDRVVVSHGHILEAGGKHAMSTGFEWIGGNPIP